MIFGRVPTCTSPLVEISWVFSLEILQIGQSRQLPEGRVFPLPPVTKESSDKQGFEFC